MSDADTMGMEPDLAAYLERRELERLDAMSQRCPVCGSDNAWSLRPGAWLCETCDEAWDEP